MQPKQSPLQLRLPVANGRFNVWGAPRAAKYHPPTGHAADSPWTHNVSWKGSLDREQQITKGQQRFDPLDRQSQILNMTGFLRHRGASRDSARGTPRKRDTLTPIMLPGRSKFDPRNPQAEQEEMTGLWQENSALRRELKEMKKLLLSTQTGLQKLEQRRAGATAGKR